IAPVAIIDRQLPFEYTITSRSTDVVVMAHQPVQNINHSAFKSMFEREKLFGNNFNDWFRQLKLVLRVEKKMYVVEQLLPAAPAADSVANVLAEWNAIYDAYNEVACLILGSMTLELHRQFENSSPYDMIKELKAMLEKQARVESNIIYEIDMHNLVPNVNFIYNVSTKRAKHNLDSTYLWHCRLTRISKKRIEKLQHEGLLKSTDDESFDQYVSCLSGKKTRKLFLRHPERVTDLLRIIHTDVCGPLRHVSKQENQLEKTIKALRSDRGGEYISQEFKDYLKACGIVQQLTPSYTPQHNGVSERRNRTLLDMVWGCEALMKRDTPNKLQQRSVKCIFIGYPKETMGYYFYLPPENKIVVARYAGFFEKNLITQEVNGRARDLEEIQDEYTSPFEITSEIPMEVEGFEPPQEEYILILRSERTRRAPDHLCLNIEVEEHSIGDLNEPSSYKAAI
nr:hypothetical protein [Tanacetum cinerariifolium]